MYDLLFSNNFYLNFLNSFLFLIFNVFFSYLLHLNFKQRNLILINQYQPIIIFFCIFALISFIFNILILFNAYEYFKHALILLSLIQILFVIKYFNLIKKIKLKSLEFDKTVGFIILILFSLYLISILPISDADSIALHQNLSNEIYLKGLKNVDIEKNLSFTIYSNTQNLLIISPIINSDNFGSQLNFLIFVLFFIYKYSNNKSFVLILLSCPLIIYFISAQKLQLFFGILYLVTFIIIHEKLIKNKIDLFLTILLLVFYSSGNLSYILFALPLYVYLFYNYKQRWLNILLYSIVSFIFILLPVLLIKYIYFNNLIAPFLDAIFGTNNFLYNAYSYSIRSTEGWLNNPADIKKYIRPFFSFKLSELSSSLGIIFLLMLISFKLQKELKFFPLIIIGIVISTGQILPRYYLEAFLILAYYFNLKNIYIKLLTYSQNFIILIISIIFISIAYLKMNVLNNKNEYMNNFSYSYYNANQLMNLETKSNILNLSLDRPSLFFKENIFSSRTFAILNDYDKFDKYFIQFINKKSIDYLISENDKSIPSCLKLDKIGQISQTKVVRNFLRKPLKRKSFIFKIKNNNCK